MHHLHGSMECSCNKWRMKLPLQQPAISTSNIMQQMPCPLTALSCLATSASQCNVTHAFCHASHQDNYSDVFRFTASVFPSEDDHVVTSPYNALLAAAQLVEHADCVLPIENQALLGICAQLESKQATVKPGTAVSGAAGGCKSVSRLQVLRWYTNVHQ